MGRGPPIRGRSSCESRAALIRLLRTPDEAVVRGCTGVVKPRLKSVLLALRWTQLPEVLNELRIIELDG